MKFLHFHGGIDVEVKFQLILLHDFPHAFICRDILVDSRELGVFPELHSDKHRFLKIYAADKLRLFLLATQRGKHLSFDIPNAAAEWNGRQS